MSIIDCDVTRSRSGRGTEKKREARTTARQTRQEEAGKPVMMVSRQESESEEESVLLLNNKWRIDVFPIQETSWDLLTHTRQPSTAANIPGSDHPTEGLELRRAADSRVRSSARRQKDRTRPTNAGRRDGIQLSQRGDWMTTHLSSASDPHQNVSCPASLPSPGKASQLLGWLAGWQGRLFWQKEAGLTSLHRKKPRPERLRGQHWSDLGALACPKLSVRIFSLALDIILISLK